jgi:hypothetical protein
MKKILEKIFPTGMETLPETMIKTLWPDFRTADWSGCEKQV